MTTNHNQRQPRYDSLPCVECTCYTPEWAYHNQMTNKNAHFEEETLNFYHLTFVLKTKPSKQGHTIVKMEGTIRTVAQAKLAFSNQQKLALSTS